MKKLLLTGRNGFVGQTIQSIVAKYGAQYDLELVIPTHEPDLSDQPGLYAMLADTQPDYLIHLAAQSFVPAAIKNPRETFEINFLGTLNLLQALKQANFRGRMIYVGSGDVYGLVDTEALPILETYPLKPRNPYAVSKVAAEALCYQWSQTEGMDVVMVRPFNHVGAGQSEHFVVSDFAKQVTQIKLGLRAPVLEVGDIDVTRDFTDVRDVVRAYLLLLRQGCSGEVYNVGSGQGRTVRALLEALLDIAGVTATITQNVVRLRPAEQRRVYASPAKLFKETGWQPQIKIEQSLKDALMDWEQKLKNG